MAVVLGISLTVLLLPHPDLLIFLASICQPIHRVCLSTTPTGSYKPFYDAIVCGANLDPSLASPFRITGLIHVLVVSGSHLIFLLTILEWVSPRKLHGPLLLAFILMTGVQPPALRAGVALVLQSINRKFRLSWTSLQVTLASGFLLWSIFPSLILNFSYLLSWSAALAIGLAPGRGFVRNVWIFVILVPVLAPLSTPHPASIFMNWILAPAIGGVLFPASIAATLFHVLAPAVDLIWALLEWLVTFVGQNLGARPEPLAIPLWALWAYLWTLTFAAQFYRVWSLRD